MDLLGPSGTYSKSGSDRRPSFVVVTRRVISKSRRPKYRLPQTPPRFTGKESEFRKKPSDVCELEQTALFLKEHFPNDHKQEYNNKNDENKRRLICIRKQLAHLVQCALHAVYYVGHIVSLR